VGHNVADAYWEPLMGRDRQFPVCPEAFCPGPHRLVINQATGVDIGHALQRQPPALFRTGRIPGIGLSGQAALLCGLGFPSGCFGAGLGIDGVHGTNTR
jgi:hypothetical protein